MSEGWVMLGGRYDDGGVSGGTLDRPALQRLLADIEQGLVDVVVCYKIDRLSRSLLDFTKLVDAFDRHNVLFVAVTQNFSTTSSMGLLSFAQFERELIGERIRDKIAASRKRGMWMGGVAPLGYQVCDRKLVIDEKEAAIVRMIFNRFLELGSAALLAKSIAAAGVRGRRGKLLNKGFLYKLLANRTYIGEVSHKGAIYPGQHELEQVKHERQRRHC
jgi:site-specific DNA recombinase